MGQGVQERGLSMLAEGALRNLHLDCAPDEAEGGTFSSRMLHYDDGVLVIASPSQHASAVKLAHGDRLTCSCRLGSDILRFTAEIAGRQAFQLNVTKRVPALILMDLGQPTLVQWRRYFRVSLARHSTADVTLWLVRKTDDRSMICGEVRGTLADLSGGGAGVIVTDDGPLRDLQDKQLWARFALPGENESLIFRVELRHLRFIQHAETHHVGISFIEYVDPGQHHNVIDDIIRYVSAQERVHLRNRKDR